MSILSPSLPNRPIQNIAWILIFWLSLFFLLIYLKHFLAPIILGCLLAFLFFPVAHLLEKVGLPRVLSILVSIFIGLGILYATIFFLYKNLSVFMAGANSFSNTAKENIHDFSEYLQTGLGLPIDLNPKEIRDLLRQQIDEILGATAQTLYVIFIMPVYIFICLFYRNKFQEFFIQLFKNNKRSDIESTIQEVSHVMTRYTTGIFIVVCILCCLNSLGLYIIGIKYALFFGVLAAVCNFIPYFGTIIGYTFPFLFTLLTTRGYEAPLSVFFLFAIVQITENNILTPNIVGGKLRLSAVTVIIGVTLGGFIWGVVGMFISIPIIAITKIILESRNQDSPWVYLLSDKGTEKHALNFTLKRKHKTE